MNYCPTRFLPKFIASLFISLLGLLFQVSLANAAVTVKYEWTEAFGGTGRDEIEDIKTDSDGNIYVTGFFENTVDFNPGGTGGEYTSNGGRDVFLTKYTNAGDYLWTKTFGGSALDLANSIAIDTEGNVYIVGPFGDTVDFDPDGSGDIRTSAGSNDVFIVKYSNDGNYLWVKTFGGTGSVVGGGIEIDKQGNIYIAGYFQGTANFDPSGNEYERTSNGGLDVFISKLTSEGNHLWTNTFGGTVNDTAGGLTIDNDGNPIIIGVFRNTVDFDSDGDGDEHISNGGADVFVSKFSTDGSYEWTRTFGGIEDETVSRGVTLDISGNIYVTGYFQGAVDFNPDGISDIQTSNGGTDIFLTKYSGDGNYISTIALGGIGGNGGQGVLVSSDGSIYISGFFQGTVNFNPNGLGDERTSVGGLDMFLTKYSIEMEYLWTKTMGGNGTDTPRAIAIDEDGGLYIGGIFEEIVDFNPDGNGDVRTSNGGRDSFLLKLQLYEPEYSLDNYSTTIDLVEGETVVREAFLTAPPESNVEINFEVNQPDEWMGSGIEVSPLKLTFTPSNWNTPQKVTIKALSDNVQTGTRTARIKHTIVTDDADYALLGIGDVQVRIDEFDTSRPNRHNGMGGNEFSISSINGEYYGNNRTIRTSDRKPTIRFNRSLDNASGIDYYQIRLYDTDELGRKSGREYAWIDNIPDQATSTRTREGHNIKYRGNGIIIEQTSGHKYELKEGTYFMRVRAFDKAGNSRTTGEVRIIIDEKYTEEYKQAMSQGITPAPEGTRLELTHIGNIPNAGAYGLFYYTAEQMDFKGKLDPTQPGVDVVVIVNGVEIGRSQTSQDGTYSIPASVSRGTNNVEIKIASSNTEESSKKLTLVVDPTRQSFPPHLQ